MTVDDKIGDEKLQYDINREAAIISPLSSGKNEQAKCSYQWNGKKIAEKLVIWLVIKLLKWYGERH